MNALFIIDMQDAYFKTPRLIQAKDGLVNAINELVREARSNKDLIVNVKTVHSPYKQTWTLNMIDDDKGFAFEGTDEIQTVTGLDLDDAVEIVKTRDSAFHDTALLQLLRTRSVESITLAGVSTHSCIFHTAAAAYAYDFPTRIVEPAVSDENEALHRQALAYLKSEYRQEIVS